MKRMSARYEPDDRTTKGEKILPDESISKIRGAHKQGPILVQQLFYRGASCPRVFGFDDFEDFEELLKDNAVPGDAYDI